MMERRVLETAPAKQTVPHFSLYVSKQEKREGGATLSLKRCPGALLRCHMKLPLSPSAEPEATEPLGMALLSSLLAAWSYISGGC